MRVFVAHANSWIFQFAWVAWVEWVFEATKSSAWVAWVRKKAEKCAVWWITQMVIQKTFSLPCWRNILAWSFWEVIMIVFHRAFDDPLMSSMTIVCSFCWIRLKKVYTSISFFCCISCAFVCSFCIERFQNPWSF